MLFLGFLCAFYVLCLFFWVFKKDIFNCDWRPYTEYKGKNPSPYSIIKELPFAL